MSHKPNQLIVMRFLLTAGAVCVLNLTMIEKNAYATCGDYLSHTGQQREAFSDSMIPPDQNRTPQQLPCSGPRCQKHEPDPSPESPMIVITSLKPACSLLMETHHRRRQISDSMNSCTLILSGDYRQRIERPPQFSGS
ncbi:MAG: hypothetical protein K0U82_14230 [Planctomycetes bacterium]|nr:hypothetical protein [Planctomycetota bacterium]